MDEVLRNQLRTRLRRWSTLLDPPSLAGEGRSARLRRSTLRSQIAHSAARYFARARGRTDGPARVRYDLTASVRKALFEIEAEARSALDSGGGDGAFARAHLVRLDRLRSMESTIEGADVVGSWDVVLTAAELRPSSVSDTAAALVRAATNIDDALLRPRVEGQVRSIFEAGVGGYLSRRGIGSVEAGVAAFWDTIEPSLLLIEPADTVLSVAAEGARNLQRWDEILEGLEARLSARGEDEDSVQGAVERFLDPRVMAAYLTLPSADLERLALTVGRRLSLATLTGPRFVQPRPGQPEPVDSLPAPDPDAEGLLIERTRWEALFAGITAAVDADALSATDLNFLFLTPSVGAGEAWRLSGGALGRVGSANYHLKRLLKALQGHVEGSGALERFSNPSKPDARARAIIGLFTAKDGDPFIDGAAEIAAEQRTAQQALSPEEIVALLYLFNLGSEGLALLPSRWRLDSPGRLMARALAHRAWDRSRRLCLLTAIVRVDGASAPPPRRALGHPEMLFLLASMVHGLPSEVSALLDGRGVEAALALWAEEAPWVAAAVARKPWPADVPGLLSKWLSSADAGPTNEVLSQLGQLGRARTRIPPLEAEPGKRPVEREAQLRLHLRQIVSGP